MDPQDHPNAFEGGKIGLTTFLGMLLAATISCCIVLLTISELAQIGPDVGEIVVFHPGGETLTWVQPGIPVAYASAGDWTVSASERGCVLTPSVMAAAGGRLIVEAKSMTRPSMFRVHWSGERTDAGSGDCGAAADLVIPLNRLRALATIAGANDFARRRHAF
jgi:hypothetical protein